MTELTEHVNFSDDPVRVRAGGVDLTAGNCEPIADDYNEPTNRKNRTVRDLECSDMVNHPAHYTKGRSVECIVTLEETVARAPDPVKAGLHWQALKYQLRLWDKENPLEDALKSRWYLDRLISKMEREL